jgi:rod shape-determining protein MreD
MQNISALAPVRSRRSPTRALVAVAATLLLAAVVQTTAGAYLPAGWPRLDLVLLFALAWGYLRGSAEGFLAAVMGGALLDLLSAAPFGLHMLALGAASLLIGQAGALFADSALRRSVGAVAAAAVVHLVAMVVVQLHGWEIWWPAVLVRSILPALAADAVILPVCYSLLQRLPEPQADALGSGI